MKTTYVREWMTQDPITADVKTHLTDAHEVMKKNSIRRLPVLREKNLVGIVTLGDIRQAMPSDVTSLSIYELNYLLEKITIDEIMSPDLITIGPGDKIQEAAQLMLENKIGGLPVLDAQKKLVGIITESDIFRIVATGSIEG